MTIKTRIENLERRTATKQDKEIVCLYRDAEGALWDSDGRRVPEKSGGERRYISNISWETWDMV